METKDRERGKQKSLGREQMEHQYLQHILNFLSHLYHGGQNCFTIQSLQGTDRNQKPRKGGQWIRMEEDRVVGVSKIRSQRLRWGWG